MENLVLKKNTMTVTGRTAIKRVFPDAKNGRQIMVNGTKVALYRAADEVFAITVQCPHRKGPLHMGDIEDLDTHGPCVVCPWHRWTFRLRDGACVKPSGREKDAASSALTYTVQVDSETGEISVGFQSFANSLFDNDEF